MWLQSVSFAVGVLLCQQLTNLPGWFFSLVSLAVLLTFIVLYLEDFSSWAITIFWLLIGFFWSVLSAHWTLADKLPENLIKQPLEVVGVIADLPERHGKDWRFNFRIDQASYLGEPVKIPKKVRLSWYRTSQAISSGQTWHLQVKLKPPSGLRNFGLFDLEGWYFQHNIRARGYVLDSEKNSLVKPAGVLNFDSWREKLRENLERYGGASNAVAMTKALTLGDKSQISREDWQIFQRLGINHLVAISGLHIGIISLLAYGVSGRLWRLSARLCEKVAAPQVQALSGLVFAIGYAGLAGFSLPTQRALVMIAILLLSRLLLVNMQPYRQFFLALLVVLIWQPSAIISAGFWLSFVAVAAIFYVLHFSADSSTFVRLIKMQLVISLALMPLTLWFFQQVSVISPLVNLVLIPLFSFLIVPAALLIALLSFLDHPWIDFLIQGYFQVLEYFLDHLALLATPDWLVIEFPGLTGAQYFLIFAIVSVGFLRFKSKLKLPLWLGCGLLLPITNIDNENGAMKLTVLDVGQGSAYLVETSDKVLLYDLGPRYGSGSATRSVVIPYLKNRGLTAIDTVVISHADSDHAGDVRSLLAEFKVDEVLVGETVKYVHHDKTCHTAMPWQWKTTRLRFLSVAKQSGQTGNNASCVLLVSHQGFNALLTGDIEKPIERQLVRQWAAHLKSDLVLVPHHGSRSSSTASFVDHVNPDWVVNSSGYLNRYNFPVDSVKRRWTQNGAEFIDTATSGSIEFVVDHSGNLQELRTFHQHARKYWHQNRFSDGPR